MHPVFLTLLEKSVLHAKPGVIRDLFFKQGSPVHVTWNPGLERIEIQTYRHICQEAEFISMVRNRKPMLFEGNNGNDFFPTPIPGKYITHFNLEGV